MNTEIIAFAITAHQKTNHLYDEKPYSVHLAMVVHYATKYIDAIPAHCQEAVISACWLHDTIEDCRMSYNDIVKVAGQEVAEIVYAVTNEKGRTRKERACGRYYSGIRNTPRAKYVKLCDRLANVKYSVDTKSRMLLVYQNENASFLNAILSTTDKRVYKHLLKELEDLLAEPELSRKIK